MSVESPKGKMLRNNKSVPGKANSRLSPADPNFKSTVLSYKYSSPPLSLFEYLYLDNFWEWFTRFYPMWLPPNVITLTGFSFVIAAYAYVTTNSPMLEGTLDPPVYLGCAACLFIYQTLDGSDGKQARRTKSGSALGELMDHGADALATTLIPVIVADANKVGSFSSFLWGLILLPQACFFLSNMTLVHFGTQKFYTFDAMEVQTATIAAFLISGILTPEYLCEPVIPVPEFMQKIDFYSFFHEDFFVTDTDKLMLDFSSGKMQLRTFFIAGGIIGTVMNYFRLHLTLLYPYLTCKKNRLRSLRCLLHHLYLLHMHLIVCGLVVYNLRSMDDVERGHGAVLSFAVIACVTFGDIMDRILLFRVGGVPLPYVTQNVMLEIAFLFCVREDATMQTNFEERMNGIHWWTALAALAVLNHVSFFAKAVSSLAAVLNIHPFRIKNKQN